MIQLDDITRVNDNKTTRTQSTKVGLSGDPRSQRSTNPSEFEIKPFALQQKETGSLYEISPLKPDVEKTSKTEVVECKPEVRPAEK